MKIFNIRERPEFMREVSTLEFLEWGNRNIKDLDLKINQKVKKINDSLDNPLYLRLILVDKSNLIGFISIFPYDGDERRDLSPWYATMYVKKEYRGRGFSKILNDAVLKEARKMGIKRLYLKTDLVNYYEKFGFIYMDKLSNGERVYYIDL